MSVLSSPSPTLSPKPSFHSHHDRTLAGLRRSNSRSYRLSPSSPQASYSHASSPVVQFQQTPPTSAPAPASTSASTKERPRMVDAGTQYSPPDYPPTTRRSMSSTSIFGSAIQHSSNVGVSEQQSETAQSPASTDLPRESPPQPVLRRDPEPHSPPASSVSATTASGDAPSPSAELGSLSKKARGEMPVKVMPLDYMKCDVRDLGIVISDMLLELVRINDPLPFKNENLTRYHSRLVSPIFKSGCRAGLTGAGHLLPSQSLTTSTASSSMPRSHRQYSSHWYTISTNSPLCTQSSTSALSLYTDILSQQPPSQPKVSVTASGRITHMQEWAV